MIYHNFLRFFQVNITRKIYVKLIPLFTCKELNFLKGNYAECSLLVSGQTW